MLLVLGILLWSGAHLFTAIAAPARQRLIARLGSQPYRGLFALTIVASLAAMVVGWRAFPPTSLWIPPAGMRHATMLLMPFAVILFIGSRMPTDLKQFIRHLQLTAVKLWAVAHLLANGETRSVILFGGLLAWAVLEVIFINRRDGIRQKPPRVGAAKTAIGFAIGLILTAVLMLLHPWFAGVAIVPIG